MEITGHFSSAGSDPHRQICSAQRPVGVVENGSPVKVSCPMIPRAWIESELFGHEKGAFTGAYGSKPSRLELAHRGALFPKEVGEMGHTRQAMGNRRKDFVRPESPSNGVKGGAKLDYR